MASILTSPPGQAYTLGALRTLRHHQPLDGYAGHVLFYKQLCC